MAITKDAMYNFTKRPAINGISGHKLRGQAKPDDQRHISGNPVAMGVHLKRSVYEGC